MTKMAASFLLMVKTWLGATCGFSSFLLCSACLFACLHHILDGVARVTANLLLRLDAWGFAYGGIMEAAKSEGVAASKWGERRGKK